MNDELQELAKELSNLDRSVDFARAAALEQRIACIELGELKKNHNGTAYFPLLKKYNGVISFEDFYDIFIDVLMGLLRGYNHEKGTFATALSFLLNKRVNNYWKIFCSNI